MSLLDLAEDPTNILTLGVAALTFATMVTLATPFLKRDTLEVRLKSVANRREELRRRSRQAMTKEAGSLRHSDEGMYKKVVERLQLSKLLEDPKVVDRLAEAGFRGPRPISTFYFFRFVTPFVMFTLCAIYLFFIKTFGLAANLRLALSFLGFGLGFYAPNLYIGNLATKRRQSIVAVFPDALDLLLICVESGMSIESALHKVSQEVGSSSIELAEELSLLVAELSYLPERRQAYEGLGRRINYPGIKSVATAMIQAERYGTPLGGALRVMSKENRELRMSAAEKKAAALPAKLTVPMIIFFLPVLFLVIIGPAIIRVGDTLKHSHP
jgi:tight adherence protein C